MNPVMLIIADSDHDRDGLALRVRRAQSGVGGVSVPRHAAVRRRHRPRQVDPAAAAERGVPVLPHGRRARRRARARRAGRTAELPVHEARPCDRRPVRALVDLAVVLDVRARPTPEQHRHLRHRRAVAPRRRCTRCSAGSCARRIRCAVASGRCSSARACCRCSRIVGSLGIFKPGGPWTPSDHATTRQRPRRRDAQLRRSRSATTSATASRSRAFGSCAAANRCRSSPSMGGIIFLGILGTGQFSAWFELIIVVLVVAVNEGQVRQLMKWLAAGERRRRGDRVARRLDPARRLRQQRQGSCPHSWQGRIDNLTNFYVPRLSGFKWVLGVRPDTVLPAPETWRDDHLPRERLSLAVLGRRDPARAGVPVVAAPRIPANPSSREHTCRRHWSRRGSHARRAVVSPDSLADRPAPDASRRSRPVLLSARPRREPQCPTNPSR